MKKVPGLAYAAARLVWSIMWSIMNTLKNKESVEKGRNMLMLTKPVQGPAMWDKVRDLVLPYVVWFSRCSTVLISQYLIAS